MREDCNNNGVRFSLFVCLLKEGEDWLDGDEKGEWPNWGTLVCYFPSNCLDLREEQWRQCKITSVESLYSLE